VQVYNPTSLAPVSLGTRLGPYHITAIIGAGEVADVYKAIDTRLNRPAATIKLLIADCAPHLNLRERVPKGEGRWVISIAGRGVEQRAPGALMATLNWIETLRE
jgi:hypothetical protein